MGCRSQSKIQQKHMHETTLFYKRPISHRRLLKKIVSNVFQILTLETTPHKPIAKVVHE